METKKILKAILNTLAFVALTLAASIDGNNAASHQAPQPRIYSGWTASPGQFPYQVLVICEQSDDYIIICGGSIISRSYILTAAHCVDDYPETPWLISVRAGTIVFNEGGVLKDVSEVIIHPQFSKSEFVNDIALLKLYTSLEFNDVINYIPFGKKKVPVGAQVIVSGWGWDTDRTRPNVLKYNKEFALSHDECVKHIGRLANSVKCFGKSVGNGICHGDSGGPAVFNGELIGVAAFTINGCGSGFPDGYTDVVDKREWILQNIECN